MFSPVLLDIVFQVCIRYVEDNAEEKENEKCVFRRITVEVPDEFNISRMSFSAVLGFI